MSEAAFTCNTEYDPMMYEYVLNPTSITNIYAIYIFILEDIETNICVQHVQSIPGSRRCFIVNEALLFKLSLLCLKGYLLRYMASRF